MTSIFLPKEIYFGNGSLEQIDSLGERCKSAFIVTDKNIVNIGLLDIITAKLDSQGIRYMVYDDVQPDPAREDVERGVDILKKEALNPDWIIAVGGGSVIDVSKALFVFWEHPHLTWDEVLYPAVVPKLRNKCRLMCISTTSGTGSEVSMASVISFMEPSPPIKQYILSPEIIADIAIADPMLTMNLPPAVTATTGLDVVVHAVESYTTRGANAFSDALALQALKMTFEYLPIAYREGANNKKAREMMHTAQLLATASCANAGLGLAHCLGQNLGSVFHIPHGIGCGVPLPYVIKFNSRVAAGRYADIAHSLGLSYSNEEEAVNKLIEALAILQKSIGIPLTIKDLGVSEDDFAKNVDIFAQLCKEDRGLTGANPVEPTVDEIKELYLSAYYGKGL